MTDYILEEMNKYDADGVDFYLLVLGWASWTHGIRIIYQRSVDCL